ncbi:MAG: glycerol dehydrogenase [Candidatus Omnitrophota bacterium]
MLYAAVFPGRYIQGQNALYELGSEIAHLGKTGFLICSPTVYKKVLPDLKPRLDDKIKYHLAVFRGESTDAEIERLSIEAKKERCDVICGIGGGKTLDTAKAVACNLNLPVIIAPTIASTDAPTSALAVIYNEQGIYQRERVLKNNPNVVLVDTTVIADAPIRFLVSGMGDALSTFFEAESCRKKQAKNFAGFRGLLTGYAIAELCYKTLLTYGKLAKKSAETKVFSPALEYIVEANTLLSGIGFESCGIAAAHSIHNGFTVLPQTRAYYHGEKVAFGTLASLFLNERDKTTVDEVYNFCREIGLPVTLAELGLKDISDEAMMKVAEKACASGEFMGNEPVPVGPDDVFSAIKRADAYGRAQEQ